MNKTSTASFIRPELFWRDLGVRANQTIVHLGCGAGYFLIPVAKMIGRKGRAIGVDILPDMLQETEDKARRQHLEGIVQTIRADLETEHGSSLDDNIADWTLVANILYQADPAKIIAEANRITKPGGTIIVIDWDPAASPLGPPVATRVAKQEVLNIIRHLQLSVQSQFDPSPYHYGLLLKKESLPKSKPKS